jgi:hypothetical protein
MLIRSAVLISVIGAALAQSPGAPTVTLVPFPYFAGAHAIWGATGQDARGHLWFGVETGGITPTSAHLLEFAPETGRFIDRGNVVAELTRLGLARPGENQAKIHSRIVQLGNFLYFASMDEGGENADGSKLPTWGGHFWRMNLATHRWEHLLTTKEALIAVGAGGGHAYALGYFGHVLYQYDVRTGQTARVEIGSIDGHITRNFLVDHRGHAYVPRVQAEAAAGKPRRIVVSLIELDATRREVEATPIATDHYVAGDDATGSHGIVGLQEMADGAIFFTTHTGHLYRIAPPSRTATGAARAAAAAITAIGLLHPDGSSYSPSLFTSDGTSTLMSLGQHPNGPFVWITCAVPVTRCRTSPVVLPERDHPPLKRALLYGSSTRDARGGHYVVGIASDYRPVILRIQPSLH